MKNTKAIKFYSPTIPKAYVRFKYIDTSSDPYNFQYAYISLINQITGKRYSFRDYNEGEFYLIPAGYYSIYIQVQPGEFSSGYMYNDINLVDITNVLLSGSDIITITKIYTSNDRI